MIPKLLLPFFVVIIALSFSMGANAQFFGFGGSDKKPSATTNQPQSGAPATPSPVLTPDQFKSTVKTLDEQTKQGLKEQRQQNINNKQPSTIKNVTPPAATGTPSTGGATTPSSENRPLAVPQTPPTEQPRATAPTAQQAPETTTTSPGGTQEQVYTGFQTSPPTTGTGTGKSTGTGQQGQQNWNIQY